MYKIKNIAIIAHVITARQLGRCDAQASRSLRDNEKMVERVMDSNDIEKERGITIFSSAHPLPTRLQNQSVDTPVTPILAEKCSAL
jgi:GTP-binding protein